METYSANNENHQSKAKISEGTMYMLADLVTGDGKVIKDFSPENGIDTRSVTDLKAIFEYFLSSDREVYENRGSNWINRYEYAKLRIRQLNERGRISEFIEYYWKSYIAPLEGQIKDKVFSIVNKHLSNDGFRLREVEGGVTVEKTGGSLVKTENIKEINNEFIADGIEKCEKKIKECDFTGAVTSARSLLESILKYIYKNIFNEEVINMDLPNLYKKVTKELKLHSTSNLDDSLKKVARGLSASVVGISEVRNMTSDAHGNLEPKYSIEEHHALLVVNAVKTIAQFLFHSYTKQHKNSK